MTIAPVLTIAGSDSSGGAGIQADLKTMTMLGCFGMSAITALTAQNTTGVREICPVPAAFLEQQIAAVCEDIPPLAVKDRHGVRHSPDTRHCSRCAEVQAASCGGRPGHGRHQRRCPAEIRRRRPP